MNNQTNEKIYGTKEYLKEKLEGLDTIYVVYLNEKGTRLMLYYINKETGRLEKVWINTIMYDKKDFPAYWGNASKNDAFKYCFRVNFDGTSRSLEAIHSIYDWTGIGVQYNPSNLPRVEALN